MGLISNREMHSTSRYRQTKTCAVFGESNERTEKQSLVAGGLSNKVPVLVASDRDKQPKNRERYEKADKTGFDHQQSKERLIEIATTIGQ